MEVASGPAAWNTSGVPCARAVSLTASSIDSKPKAAMTVERMFELVTDCLVCMGFSFLRFGFGFSGVFIVVPVHALKRKGRLKPATTEQFFLGASGRDVKIPPSVLEFARRAASMTTPLSTRQEVTQLLGDWGNGDEGALAKRFPMEPPE